MSRYSAQLGDKTLAWGYDSPLQEYFIQLYSDHDDRCIFELGTVATTQPHPDYPGKKAWSRGEILGIYEQYAEYIPQKHRDAVALDMVF